MKAVLLFDVQETERTVGSFDTEFGDLGKKQEVDAPWRRLRKLYGRAYQRDPESNLSTLYTRLNSAKAHACRQQSTHEHLNTPLPASEAG